MRMSLSVKNLDFRPPFRGGEPGSLMFLTPGWRKDEPSDHGNLDQLEQGKPTSETASTFDDDHPCPDSRSRLLAEEFDHLGSVSSTNLPTIYPPLNQHNSGKWSISRISR